MVRWIRTAISAMEVARRVSPVVVLVVVPLYALMGFGALGDALGIEGLDIRRFPGRTASGCPGLGLNSSRPEALWLRA